MDCMSYETDTDFATAVVSSHGLVAAQSILPPVIAALNNDVGNEYTVPSTNLYFNSDTPIFQESGKSMMFVRMCTVALCQSWCNPLSVVISRNSSSSVH